MAVSDIFKMSCCGSCGLCCSKKVLCAKCEIATLKANGLSETLHPQITGLVYVWNGNGRDFMYSPLYNKINELLKEAYEKADNGDYSMLNK